MNIVSIIIGVFALLLVLFSFLFIFMDLMDWFNFSVIALPVIGLIVGMFDKRTSGRNLNAVALGFGIFRFMLSRLF